MRILQKGRSAKFEFPHSMHFHSAALVCDIADIARASVACISKVFGWNPLGLLDPHLRMLQVNLSA